MISVGLTGADRWAATSGTQLFVGLIGWRFMFVFSHKMTHGGINQPIMKVFELKPLWSTFDERDEFCCWENSKWIKRWIYLFTPSSLEMLFSLRYRDTNPGMPPNVFFTLEPQITFLFIRLNHTLNMHPPLIDIMCFLKWKWMMSGGLSCSCAPQWSPVLIWRSLLKASLVHES